MIKVENVTKKYGNFTAIDDISFEIKDGEIVGLLGQNGAGKSTTMNMMTGFIEPTKGKIVINGYDISKKPNLAKRQIGYMPEGVPLYTELTVREFIKYMAELKLVKKSEIKQELGRVIKDTGLEEVQNKIIKNLSRGFKQRVSLAGSLVGNPKILILDEPTVGLDPKQITEIREEIKKLGKSHTVILSSHILSEVSQICEKVIIINKGKLVAIDTPKNLEEKTVCENTIILTVEDKEDKINTVIEKIANIKDIKNVKINDDKTKEYVITTKDNSDIRKEIFEVLSKEQITIFEMRKTQNTLEDAFIKLINDEGKNQRPLKSSSEKKEIDKTVSKNDLDIIKAEENGKENKNSYEDRKEEQQTDYKVNQSGGNKVENEINKEKSQEASKINVEENKTNAQINNKEGGEQ